MQSFRAKDGSRRLIGKRRRLELLVPWKCCCDDLACATRFASREECVGSAVPPHPLLFKDGTLDAEDSLVFVDTHVHLDEVFMKIQVSEEVPSLRKAWEAMTEEERRCWATLGFNRLSWFVRPEQEDATDQVWQLSVTRYGTEYYWNRMTGEMTWDTPVDSVDADGEETFEGSLVKDDRDPFNTEWVNLLPQEREAAISVGYTESIWDQTSLPRIPSPEALRQMMPTFGCIATGCDPQSLEHMLAFHRSIPLPPQCSTDTVADDYGFPGFVWVALGCHPKTAATMSLLDLHEAWTSLEEFEMRLQDVASELGRRLIAWGEIGLDYSHALYGTCKRNQWFQQEAFKRQVAIGLKLGLPLVVHSRAAWQDTISILKEQLPRDYPIHVHCFWDTKSAMDELFHEFPRAVIGFSNNIFWDGDVPQELCRHIQLEHVVLETDAPYLARPGAQMSTMGDIPAIGQKVADIKGLQFGTVMRAVRQNVFRVYNI